MCDKFKSVLIIGSGPIVIGQSAEYDYSAVQACLALKEEGIRVIVVNSNPATVMTDKEYADAVYIEPLNIDVVKRIIVIEKPDCILPTMGGEKGFEIALELQHNGFLDKKKIVLLSLNNDFVKNLDKKESFKKLLTSINEPFVEYKTVDSVEDAVHFANEAGYPVIIRTAYEVGNKRFEICYDLEQLSLKAKDYLEVSLLRQVIIEKCVSGWKEIEYEVIRDGNGNCISVSNMENLDPVGINSGDSIIIIPAQTISHEESEKLRATALKIINSLNIIGNCGIQFALNPQGTEYVVLSITPRFSRASTLISKASGYPIARICAKLVAGCNLFDIVGWSAASKEPAIDHCAVKFPTWSFEKFENVDRKLGSETQATGETLSFGKTFEHAFLKAIRSIDAGSCLSGLQKYKTASDAQLLEVISESDDERIFAVYEAIRRGLSVDTVCDMTKIDPWFLEKIKNITWMETLIASHYSQDTYHKAKIMGFSDQVIESISGCKSKNIMRPSFTGVDVSMPGVDSAGPYYSYFEGEAGAFKTAVYDDNFEEEKKKILVIGAGATTIGHGSELEFCLVQCITALKSAGYTVIVVNNNPQAVSTDDSLADRLYIEPLSSEDIENIIIAERPFGIITQFSGENFYRLTNALSKSDVKIIGADSELIDILTSTEKTGAMLAELKIPFSAENIFNATGIEVDAIGDGAQCFIPGISEHIEKSGIHPGDSISICPPISLNDKHKQLIVEYAEKITLALKIRGIINIRFILNDNRLYVTGISCNLMHNIPFICKATGLRTIELALRCMLGEKLAHMGCKGGVNPGKNLFAVRVPVFSFDKLSGTDTQLGSEMKSTGEVLGLASTFEDALLKGLIASGVRIKRSGGVLVTVRNSDKQEAIPVAEKFAQLDFNLHATAGTAKTLNANHVPSSSIRKIHEDSPHILDLINSNKVVYVISTSEKAENAHGDDVKIRRRAIEKQIPTFTTLETANALAGCLKKKRSLEDIDLIDITKF